MINLSHCTVMSLIMHPQNSCKRLINACKNFVDAWLRPDVLPYTALLAIVVLYHLFPVTCLQPSHGHVGMVWSLSATNVFFSATHVFFSITSNHIPESREPTRDSTSSAQPHYAMKLLKCMVGKSLFSDAHVIKHDDISVSNVAAVMKLLYKYRVNE